MARGAVIQTKVGDKLRRIRIKAGRTLEVMGNIMYCGASTIRYYESGNGLTPEVLDRFKKALEIEGTPLTDEELAAFRKALYELMNLIKAGDMAMAKELRPKMEIGARWCLEPEVELLFDLMDLPYIYLTEGEEAFKARLLTLSKREHEFTKEHYFWYHRHKGTAEYFELRYPSSYDSYVKAISLTKGLGDRLDLGDFSLPYNPGLCLTHMGYPYQALEYLDEALESAVKRNYANETSQIQSIRRHMAICNSMLGQEDKAFAQLHECLRKEKSNSGNYGAIYCDIGMVHHNAGNPEKAVESFKEAAKHTRKEGEIWLYLLCREATSLLALKMFDKVMERVNEGLPMVEKKEIYHFWLKALEHATK